MEPKSTKQGSKPEPQKGKGKNKKQPQKEPTPATESEASDVDDAVDESERPAKKRRLGKGTRKNKVISDGEDGAASDLSEDEGHSHSSEPPSKPPPKRLNETESDLSDVPDETSKAIDEESELSEVIDEPPKQRKQKSKSKAPPKPKAKPPTPDDNDSSSELSSVIDDPPPPPKRKRKSKDGSASSGPAKGKSAKSSTSTADLSPDEAQIKLLQSQLAKCGVRKVWAFEFKKRGDDTPKAKIKRLKEVLADVGMTGRFSEAKAREIKEMRELQADLNEVMEGEKSWGVESGRGRGAKTRLAGSKKKTLKGVGEDDGDEDKEGKDRNEGKSDGSDDEDGGKPVVRGKGLAKRRADLAFLDDESESE
jgi:hypothetical protein